MKAAKIILLIVLILLILVFVLLAWRLYGPGAPAAATPSPAPSPSPTPEPPVVGTFSIPSSRDGDDVQALLEQAYAASWGYLSTGPLEADGQQARLPLRLHLLDADALAGSGLREELLERLQERVDQTGRREEIFGEDGAYRPELLQSIYQELLQDRLLRLEDFCGYLDMELRYVYSETGWTLQNEEALYPLRPDAEELYSAATAELPLLKRHYSLPEEALKGYLPNASGFLLTEDPAEVLALLEKPEAKDLIGDQSLLWNPELPFVPGTKIRCYLDESLLCIVWQEPENGCLGTFSEVFIADGSQLRRKISSDEPWSLWFKRTTEFAMEANAVLAFGGDFYYHDRNCGVSVYQRQMVRFRPDNADTCFITADGDMLFLYRGPGFSQEEMEQYLIDNDVVFSLAFGPVMIDEGVDVTPENYPWGETKEYFARSALGMLGRHHYLTMNLNCLSSIPELDHLPTLRDAADAMVKRGCWKAYTLDGGRTATTVFNYRLINPVQYGKEIPISDIIYFATAVPME
ncbi:MAG: phosphodiester glycosidase family protein [Oscillospiraceae bacterium]|nr:phosphodiester glycosidase family protein [Oscillospiraceae bacterium]